MKGFIDGKYAVAVKHEDWDKFVKLAEAEGLKWIKGEKPAEFNPFKEDLFKNTVFLTYCPKFAPWNGLQYSFKATSAHLATLEHKIVGLNRLVPRAKAPAASPVKYTLEGFLNGKFHAIVCREKWTSLAKLLDACGCMWATGSACADYYPWGEHVAGIVCEAKVISWERPHESPDIDKAVWAGEQFVERDESAKVEAPQTAPRAKFPTAKYRIVIESDGINTTATMKMDGMAFKRGCTRCSPADKFDFEFGAALALLRLVGFKKFKDAMSAEAISSLKIHSKGMTRLPLMHDTLFARKGDDDE